MPKRNMQQFIFVSVCRRAVFNEDFMLVAVISVAATFLLLLFHGLQISRVSHGIRSEDSLANRL